jgi:hypothetical protein
MWHCGEGREQSHSQPDHCPTDTTNWATIIRLKRILLHRVISTKYIYICQIHQEPVILLPLNIFKGKVKGLSLVFIMLSLFFIIVQAMYLVAQQNLKRLLQNKWNNRPRKYISLQKVLSHPQAHFSECPYFSFTGFD